MCSKGLFMGRRGLLTVVAAGLTAAALSSMLAGCTPGPGEPGATSGGSGSSTVATASTAQPSTTASATASSSGTMSTTGGGPISVPVGARADSPDGATAFVRFVVTEVNRAYKTADVTILPRVLAPECRGCVALKDDLAKTVADGQHVSGDIWTPGSVLINIWDPGNASVTLAISQNKVDYLDREGRPVSSGRAGEFEYILTLDRTADSWRVVRWQKVVP